MATRRGGVGGGWSHCILVMKQRENGSGWCFLLYFSFSPGLKAKETHDESSSSVKPL